MIDLEVWHWSLIAQIAIIAFVILLVIVKG